MRNTLMRSCFAIILLVFSANTGTAQTNITRLAEQYLQQNAIALGVNPDVKWRVSDAMGNTRGIAHVYLQQTYAGIDIEGSMLSIHFKDGEVLHTAGRFISKIQQLASATNSNVTSVSALSSALNRLRLRTSRPLSPNTSFAIGPKQTTTFKLDDIARKDVKVQLIYTQHTARDIRLTWDVNLYYKEQLHVWNVRVDAMNGEVILVRDQVLSCNFDNCEAEAHTHSPHVHTTNTNTSKTINANLLANTYTVIPLTVESPNHGNFVAVSNPASANTSASPLGWHDDGFNQYTQTQGNNTLARDDVDGNNTGGTLAEGGASLDFNYVFDPNIPVNAGDNLNAAITNLFYWNNIMHDIFYNYGFDEESGNYQYNNFGRGGADEDLVIAEAQDGIDTNNANFFAGADGELGVMQMFLWDGPTSISNFNINSPASIVGNYPFVLAAFGNDNFSVTGDLVLVDDGSAMPTEGCAAPINAADISGKIAMIDRGNCEFGIKVLNAENAGAIAAIVCNNATGNIIAMAPGADGASVTIPSIMISQNDCAIIRAELLNASVNATITNNVIQVDGDYDSGIIAHEYGHGISIRLTGGRNDAACLNNVEQMGEGWSDFWGLVVTTPPGSNANIARGIGTYAISQSPTGNGIRPYPYTRNISVNPSTYADVSNSAFSQPHGIGSIWCTMLWDLFWNLVDDYGYDDDLYNGNGGNNIAMRLVTEACKFQACNPGFVDGRDAILAADQAIYNGANQCTIWESFARRGLGYSATQGSSNDRFDNTESFDTPPASLLNVEIEKLANLDVASCGDTITFTLNATAPNTLDCIPTPSNLLVQDILPSGLVYVAASASGGGTENGDTITWPNIPSFTSNRTYSYRAVVDCDDLGQPNANTVVDDDIENGVHPLVSISNTSGLTNWQITNTQARSGSQSWYAQEFESSPNPAETKNLIFGPFQLTGNSELRFWHLFDTERLWDGGQVAISTDGGQTWVDLANDLTQNGYNSSIANTPAQVAFSGLSNNNGTWIESVANLSNYESCNAMVRFSFYYDLFALGTADNGIDDGWYIDDIRVISGSGNVLLNQANISGYNDTKSSNVCITVNTLALDLKMILAGATKSGTIMQTELNSANLLPDTEPYTGLGYTHLAGGGGEIMTPGAKNATANDAIVDWVVVELRNPNDASKIVATRSALLTANGNVVDVDGVSAVQFFMPTGLYHVAVRHRNHLGVMTAAPLSL